MAVPKCAWCGCPDTLAGFDQYLCLNCALHTDMLGQRAVPTSQVTNGITVADIPVPPVYIDSTAHQTPAPVLTTEEEPDGEAVG